MSASAPILIARAGAHREAARYVTGLRRARLLSRAAECERLAGAAPARAATINTVRVFAGRPTIHAVEI